MKNKHHFSQIGLNIKMRRKALNLSHKELADKLNMSTRGLQAIESGETKEPPRHRLEQIAEALQMPLSELETLHKKESITIHSTHDNTVVVNNGTVNNEERQILNELLEEIRLSRELMKNQIANLENKVSSLESEISNRK